MTDENDVISQASVFVDILEIERMVFINQKLYGLDFCLVVNPHLVDLSDEALEAWPTRTNGERRRIVLDVLAGRSRLIGSMSRPAPPVLAVYKEFLDSPVESALYVHPGVRRKIINTCSEIFTVLRVKMKNPRCIPYRTLRWRVFL